MKTGANYLPEVKEQYEDYPYPERVPSNEIYQFISPFPDIPDRINHYCYGGRQNFKGFRILIAGGGTGDSTIYIAEQYAPLGATIVHLDLSTASIAIAKERAKIRGVEKNIKFVQGSLLDVAKLKLGMFDYINCTGVLHHLSNPDAGLAALVSILKPDGIMGIMLYALYGRLAIYPLQKAFKIALQNISSRSEKIQIAREIMKNLPRSNWYYFSEARAQNEIMLDAGFYDLLLHSQDRAYTVPELYEFTKNAGLNHMSLQCEIISGEFYYNPFRLIGASEITDQFKTLALPESQALAELISGNIPKHTFYTSRAPFEEPTVEDENFVPVINYLKKITMASLTQTSINTTQPLITYVEPETNILTMLRILKTTPALMLAIDNKRTIAEIIEIITSRSDFSHTEVKHEFLNLYEDLRKNDILFLRHKTVPEFDNPETLQKKMLQRMNY